MSRRILLAVAFLCLTVPTFAENTTPLLPELRPAAGSAPQPTDVMMRVGRAITGMHGDTLSEVGSMALDSAIVLYPDDPNARFMRSSFTFCGIRHGDLPSAAADIDSAIAHFGPTASPLGTSLQTAYGVKAHIELALGHDRTALTMIEKAIRLDPENAEQLFNPGTTDPDSTTPACNWRKSTMNRLVARNPSDYRAYLARGVYYGFFETFGSTYRAIALRDLVKATRLAPRSALCRYFAACEYAGGHSISALFTSRTPIPVDPNALRELTAAIALEPSFALAYAERAELRYRAKQFSLAIRDYDALIRLEPSNDGALNDRGLAKMALNDNWGAVRDLTEAARIKTADPAKAAEDATLNSTFEYLAECHAALGQFSEAADAMTGALRAIVSPFAAAWPLPRLRELFPECTSMDDETFLHTVHDAFCSTMPYATFEGMKLDSMMAQLESTVVPSDYVQRDDYYLRAGNLRAALADYARARRAFPSSAGYTERWRLATANDAQEFYIDGQAELADVARHSIWVKSVKTKKGSVGWNIDRITVDSGASTIQTEASTTYGADGNVIASHEAVGAPTIIVPESIGEWFSKAMCR